MVQCDAAAGSLISHFVTETSPLIAVVDDEESIRRALSRLLRSVGFSVQAYPSGDAFLESVETEPPDCVILDLHMPEIDGFEVQSRLVQSGARIPIVVLTGHDSPEARDRVTRLGVSAYLRKPVHDEHLLDAIAVALASRSNPA